MRRSQPMRWHGTGYVQGTNDYIFRGVSQNRRDAAVQGGVDLGLRDVLCGNVHLERKLQRSSTPWSPDSKAEIDLYARDQAEGWRCDVRLRGDHLQLYRQRLSRIQRPTIRLTRSLRPVPASRSSRTWPWAVPSIIRRTTSERPARLLRSKERLRSRLPKSADVEFAASGTIGHTFYANTSASDGVTKNLRLHLRELRPDRHATRRYRSIFAGGIPTFRRPCATGNVFQCGSAFAGTFKFSF